MLDYLEVHVETDKRRSVSIHPISVGATGSPLRFEPREFELTGALVRGPGKAISFRRGGTLGAARAGLRADKEPSY